MREEDLIILPLATKLLMAASELYVSEGRRGVSLRRLASRTGLSPTALYKRFPSRAHLLDGVAAGAFCRLDADLRRHEDVAPARVRLQAMTRSGIAFALANPRLWELMFEPRSASFAERDVLRRLEHTIADVQREDGTAADTGPAARHAREWLARLVGAVALQGRGHLNEEEVARIAATALPARS